MKWIAATALGALLVAGIPTAALVATAEPQPTFHGPTAQNAIFTQAIGYQPAVSPKGR